MSAEPRDLTLEITTLRLVNAVAYHSGTRAHSRRFEEATGLNIAPADLRLLELLYGREPLVTKVIAQELGCDITQISRQVTMLEKAGHLNRRTDPTDRRRTLVSVTDPTEELLDTWLTTWTNDYVLAVAHWTPEQLEMAGDWFTLVHHRFEQALPERPHPSAGARWAELSGDRYEPSMAYFLRSLIGLITWVGLSGGFDVLLEIDGSPVRQNGFYTLQLIAHSGPLPIAQIAERLAIDPSQASKRITRLASLNLVDRAVDGFDRRSSRIRISRRGRALLEKAYDLELAGFGALTTDISIEDRSRWTPLVQEYVDSLLQPNPGATPAIGVGVRSR